MKKSLATIVCLFLFIGMTQATTWHVPQSFNTIQEAINASVDGDVVLVAEGTYFENINFMGKKITVASLFYQDQKKIHIKRTIINGSKPANPDFGSVVSFIMGEDTSSVLCGFTITGGTGMLSAAPGFPPMRLGGGVLCWGSGAKIIYNRILGNVVKNAPWTMGGGIACTPPFIPAFVILEHNLVQNNKSIGMSRVSGGGIDFSVSGRVINNIITYNTALATVEAPAGGGLALQSWDPTVMPPNEVLVSGNTVSHNKALQPDDATYWLGGIGAGIWLIGSKGVIKKNIIQHNEVSGALSTYGSGVLLDYPPQELTLKNNLISDNYFSGSGICYGGGLGVWDGSPSMHNNIFVDNKGSVGGGMWLGYNFCFSHLVNNTFRGNQATIQGGALNTFNSHPTMMNSILWGNGAPLDAELCLESGEIDVTYCNIAGGWEGAGNIDTNPLMMNSQCLLPAASACVDAGNDLEMYNDPESSYRPGYAMLPSRGMLRSDMGAYGGPAAADWDLRNVRTKAGLPRAHKTGVKSSSSPNPFNPTTIISYQLPALSHVELAVYNILGEKVRTLVNQRQDAGQYSVVFNATGLASGVYVYKITAGQFSTVHKMILMK